MAKKKTPKKKPAKASRKNLTKAPKKKSARKTAVKSKKVFVTEGPLPPKQREKVLRKLRKLAIRPSHPSNITGPALALGYDAPLPKKSTARRGKKKR